MSIHTTSWDETLGYLDSLELQYQLALPHLHCAGERGREIMHLYDCGDMLGIAKFAVDYTVGSVSELQHLRQGLAFFQKFEHLECGINKSMAAWETFNLAESKCEELNSVFRSIFCGSTRISPLPQLVSLLNGAKAKIRNILGRCPNFEDLNFSFGPGATTTTRRSDSCPTNKLAAGIQCSTNLFASGLLPSILRELPHWHTAAGESYWSLDDEDYIVERCSVELQPSQLTFVPKSATTYRPILIEPSLNGMVQKGIGTYIARRLKRAGIDIADQSRNQRLAKEGSLSGSLATIDLSNASATICFELVRLLLPDDWFALLKATRTSRYQYNGQLAMLHSFSGMGNAFTFPLETLIFWALVRTVCKDASDNQIGVYGDDIICPSNMFEHVCRALELVGFTINLSKSFGSGPFRESCGKDYYLGIDIRPYYQKDLISGQTLFTLHNFYHRTYQMDRAREVRKLIPSAFKVFGPDGYGDGHLIGDWQKYSRFVPRLTRYERGVRVQCTGHAGYRFDTYVSESRNFISIYHGDWVSPLYCVYLNDRQPISNSIGFFEFPSEPLEVSKDPSGRCKWRLPGSKGYKRISIYTFQRP